MTTTVKNYQETIQSVAFNGTQGLNSLTNNEWVNASDAIDNSAGYPFMDLELVLGSAAFGTGSNSHLEVYVIPQVDGSNYADYGSGNTTSDAPENQPLFVGTFKTSEATEAQRLALLNVPIPDGNFKIGLRSRATVTLASSGNTLKYRRWAYQTA